VVDDGFSSTQRHNGTTGERIQMNENEISLEIVRAALEVHKALGPGLLEKAYEECMCREFSIRGIQFTRQVEVPVIYKGIKLDCGFKLDILVEDLVIIEIKAVARVLPVHEAQLLTYLKVTEKKLGLLINFNETKVKYGIRRVINGILEPINYNDL
jgi:GxxExxY protein